MKMRLKLNSNASFAGLSVIRREVDNGLNLGLLLVALTFGAICQFLGADTRHICIRDFTTAIPHIYAPII